MSYLVKRGVIADAAVQVRRDHGPLPGLLQPMAARLSDGSRLTWLNAPSGKEEERLPVRAAEHNAILSRGEGTEEASQTCTLITTLPERLRLGPPSCPLTWFFVTRC